MTSYKDLEREFGVEDFFIFHGSLDELERRDGVTYQVIDCGYDGRIAAFAHGTREKTKSIIASPSDRIDPELLKRVKSILREDSPSTASIIMFKIAAKSYGADGAIRCDRKLDRKEDEVWVSDAGIPVVRSLTLFDRIRGFYQSIYHHFKQINQLGN